MTPLDSPSRPSAPSVQGTSHRRPDERPEGEAFGRTLDRAERRGGGAGEAPPRSRLNRRPRGDDLETSLRLAGLAGNPQGQPAALDPQAVTPSGAGGAEAPSAPGAASLVTRLADEVARSAEVARVSGAPRLGVDLDLGPLGAGRVTVTRGGSGLEVRLDLEGARARELASAGLDDLRTRLASRGLGVASLELASLEPAGVEAGRRAAQALQGQTARTPESAAGAETGDHRRQGGDRGRDEQERQDEEDGR